MDAVFHCLFGRLERMAAIDLVPSRRALAIDRVSRAFSALVLLLHDRMADVLGEVDRIDRAIVVRPAQSGSTVRGRQYSGLPAADPVSGQLAEMMGDAPPCDSCGHTTVRNGACYRCLNCGNSMGCS